MAAKTLEDFCKGCIEYCGTCFAEEAWEAATEAAVEKFTSTNTASASCVCKQQSCLANSTKTGDKIYNGNGV